LAAFAAPAGTLPEVTTLDLDADSTIVLYAGRYDAYSNFIGPAAVAWSLDAPLATLAPTVALLTVLDARRAGDGNLRLDAPGLPRYAIPLAVRPGRLANLRLSTNSDGAAFGDTTLAAAATFELHAQGFDADGNRLLPPPEVDWSATGAALAVSPAHGATTSVLGAVPGTARILAASGSIGAGTGVVRVVPGPLAQLRLSLSAASARPLLPRRTLPTRSSNSSHSARTRGERRSARSPRPGGAPIPLSCVCAGPAARPCSWMPCRPAPRGS
jgi:hypothetical protein